MSFTPQCPRCGVVLRSDQRVHWPCVRARVWQVIRVPLLAVVILGGMMGGALALGGAGDGGGQDSQPQPAPSAATFPAPLTDGQRTREPVTPSPTAEPQPTPTLPPVVRITGTVGQLYDVPGVVSDILLTRDSVLIVQGIITVEGVTYYVVTSDAFGDERYVRFDDVEPLP